MKITTIKRCQDMQAYTIASEFIDASSGRQYELVVKNSPKMTLAIIWTMTKALYINFW